MGGSEEDPDGLATSMQSEGLQRNAIGLTEVLFQSITFMAPAVAVALSIGFATTFALGITPLAVLFALIAVLFTAFSMGELARHLPSAGGMYTYVGRGLGSYRRLAARLGVPARVDRRPVDPVRGLRLLRRGVHHASSPASSRNTCGSRWPCSAPASSGT